ncbi:MAG: DUF4258 domain-containing protein [Candidatus Aenigmarchaeota archaeon]|nr:DUF4258 domain-containing protein [Candidatus Aenigmarchaeota archaeon]
MENKPVKKTIKFEIMTRLNTSISLSESYWDYIITIKHPMMKNKEKDIIKTLEDPEIIRQSKTDENVYLIYRRIVYNNKPRYICVVVNKIKKILITTYITDKIKEGEEIWKK